MIKIKQKGHKEQEKTGYEIGEKLLINNKTVYFLHLY
jgi:hypothetical protein